MVIRLISSTSSNFTVSSFSESSDFPKFFGVSLSFNFCSPALLVTFSSSTFMFELIIFLRVDEFTFLGMFVQPPKLPTLDMEHLLGVSSSKQDKVSDLMEGRVACLGRLAGLSHLHREETDFTSNL